jgi:isopenicillin N synthase-like dioxygenase
MTRLLDVPVVDISPFVFGGSDAKRAVAAKVDRACRDIGFLVISGHGVSDELIQAMGSMSRRFFDLPLEAKHDVDRPAADVSRGYVGLAGESVGRSRDRSAIAGDLNESFIIGPIEIPDPAYAFAPAAGRHFAPNLWPRDLPEMEAIAGAYYRALDSVAVTLMRIFALALGLPERYFDRMVDRPISRLRLRNYPEPVTQPEPGQLRAGAHSDYGSLTILLAEDRPGGLQVNNSIGEWVDVPIVPSCFIVNIGDLMQRWTNDRWVSTLHRVVNPPDDRRAGSRRQSIVFFHNPNYDAVIEAIATCVAPGETPKYPPTTSGEHLRNLFTKTQNYV